MTAFWGPYSSNLSSSASQSVAGRNKCVFQHSHELLKNSPPRTKPEKTFSHRNTHTLTAHIQPCRRMQQAALYNQLLTRTSDLLEPLGRKLETETIVFNFSPVPLLLRLLLPVAFRRSLTVASFHFFFLSTQNNSTSAPPDWNFYFLDHFFSKFWFGCLLRTSYLLLCGKQLLDAKASLRARCCFWCCCS